MQERITKCLKWLWPEIFGEYLVLKDHPNDRARIQIFFIPKLIFCPLPETSSIVTNYVLVFIHPSIIQQAFTEPHVWEPYWSSTEKFNSICWLPDYEAQKVLEHESVVLKEWDTGQSTFDWG